MEEFNALKDAQTVGRALLQKSKLWDANVHFVFEFVNDEISKN